MIWKVCAVVTGHQEKTCSLMPGFSTLTDGGGSPTRSSGPGTALGTRYGSEHLPRKLYDTELLDNFLKALSRSEKKDVSTQTAYSRLDQHLDIRLGWFDAGLVSAW